MISTCLPAALLEQLAEYDHFEPRFRVKDHGHTKVGGNAATVRAAVGKYNFKGEDRYTVWTNKDGDDNKGRFAVPWRCVASRFGQQASQLILTIV